MPEEKLHRFSVHPWQGIEPDRVVSKSGDAVEDGFFLALALIFNDLKGLLLFESQLHPHTPEPGTFSPFAGQWSGVIIQTRRLMAGLIHELLVLIREHEGVVRSERFGKILEAARGAERESWRDLQAMALEQEGANSALAKVFVRIRNSGAFHYYNPKDLVASYRNAFFAQPKNSWTELALASVGEDMEATRYFFADEAAEALMLRSAKQAGVGEFQQELGAHVGKVNGALAAVVTLHLIERRDGSFGAAPGGDHA